MKMKRPHLLIIAWIVSAAALPANARSRMPPPTVAKVADTWIGFREDDLCYYRLTLEANGKGLCAYTFMRKPAVLYRVSEWTLDDYAVEIKLEPIDPKAEPIWMKGKTAGWHLELLVGGKNLKWKRRLKLYRETEVQAKQERVKMRMTVAKEDAKE